MFKRSYQIQDKKLDFIFEYHEHNPNAIKTLVFRKNRAREIRLRNSVVLKTLSQNMGIFDFTNTTDGGVNIIEYLQDLEYQLNILNGLPLKYDSIVEISHKAIENHIKIYGKIIYDDIDVYLNVTMNILNALNKALGKPDLSEEQGSKIYNDLELSIINRFYDNVYVFSKPIRTSVFENSPLQKISDLSNVLIYVIP